MSAFLMMTVPVVIIIAVIPVIAVTAVFLALALASQDRKDIHDLCFDIDNAVDAKIKFGVSKKGMNLLLAYFLGAQIEAREEREMLKR